jgi:hypothetical protein
MGELERWKRRVLLAEGIIRWNQYYHSIKCPPQLREIMGFCRLCYRQDFDAAREQGRPVRKPGEAAVWLRNEILPNRFPDESIKNTLPEPRTITAWIKDMAPPELSGRGRPKRK